MINARSIIIVAYCSLFATDSFAVETADDNIYELSLEDLINLKIDSASGFEESVSETPVPVTVITEAMIRNSPALSLRDLLSQYVPGFTQVQDQNEYNTAFRGVYTSSQQKILILLNGKRINSRSYSNADPAMGINLDKLSQIEVIRGPGSSIYGNVALTAVVNLQLKQTKLSGSATTKVKVGNHGLRSFYSDWQSIHEDVEYLAWASLFETKGELVTIRPQEDYSPTPSLQPVSVRLDSFSASPSLDIGLSAVGTNWSSYLTIRENHYIEPFSGGALTGEAYHYRDYFQKGKNAPGTDFHWLNFDVEKSFVIDENDQIDANLYYAQSEVVGTFVLVPNIKRYGTVFWKENTFGGNFIWKKKIKSDNLLVGIQYEKNHVNASDFSVGQDREVIARPFTDENPVLLLGKESVFSFYAEYKHRLNQQWLINIGARYDDKTRLLGEKITETSPRLALVYQDPNLNLKLAYSRSFVDPPYWNRYSALASFRGSRELKPEILESVQISPELLWFDNKISTKLNFFFNYHSDFVFRDSDALDSEPLFVNSGQMNTIGFEHEWLVYFEQHSIRVIGTHQKVSSVEFYRASENEIFNIPKSQMTVTWDTEINASLFSQVSLQYLSSRLSPIRIASNNVVLDDPFPDQGVSFDEPNNRLTSVMLFNATLRWKLKSYPI